MQIEIIDFGGRVPERAHYNDAGADVFANIQASIPPHTVARVPLGIGLKIPDGFLGFIAPRSSMASKGVTAELAPIDSGYRGEVHAILTNNTSEHFEVQKGDKVAQLLVQPIILATFVYNLSSDKRNNGAFGSTGK